MNRQQFSIIFRIIMCLALAAAVPVGPAYAGLESSTLTTSFNLFNLEGSGQGQSVGFVDINGDGLTDKIVGAPYAASDSQTGAILVYRGKAGGGFSQSPSRLLAGGDNYGYSFVNLEDAGGDGHEYFAVGAINGSGPHVSLSGYVVVYRGGKQESNEALGKVVKVAGEGPMDKFGYSISSGDLNGDGKRDLIVGAPFNTHDPALYQGGAVYVYFAPDFTQGRILYASSLNKGLGWSAATGDINGDGVADLCISVSGKILCWYGSQNFNPSIDAADVTITSASSGFGKAVAIIGDLNGDGFGDIVIGAPNAVIGVNRDTGSVYIVKGGTGARTLNLDAAPSDLIVRIDGQALFDRFGSSILPVGDIDGDQKPDFVAAAPMADADPLTTLVGKVYLFRGKDINSNTTIANATSFEGDFRDQFYGTSLAVTQDGRLLIGSPGMDDNTGGVYMVDLTTSLSMPAASSCGPTGENNGCLRPKEIK